MATAVAEPCNAKYVWRTRYGDLIESTTVICGLPIGHEGIHIDKKHVNRTNELLQRSWDDTVQPRSPFRGL